MREFWVWQNSNLNLRLVYFACTIMRGIETASITKGASQLSGQSIINRVKREMPTRIIAAK